MERPAFAGECLIPDDSRGVSLHVEHVARHGTPLRLSGRCRVRFLADALYRHRLHADQTTRQGLDRPKVLADRARARAFLKRALTGRGGRA